MSNVFLSTMLIISAILLSNLAIYGIRKRKIPGALFFSFVIIAMVLHSVGYAFELLSDNIEKMYLCIRIEYLGAAFYPFLIMLFSRDYTDEKKFANKYVLNFILIINIFTFILINTNSYHFLYYSSVGIDSSLGFNVLASEKGNLYYIQSSALFFSICYSMITFTIRFKQSKGNYRKRVVCMLVGVTIPLITFIIYILNLIPTYIDYTPFSYLPMSLFIVLGLFKFDTIFLVPVTYEMVFNSVDEAVLVVDDEDFLVNFNYASKLFFPSLNTMKIGDSIHLVNELKTYDFNSNQSILEIDKKIYNFKVIKMENKKVSIYVVTDITKSEQYKKQLEIFATEDSLTGLYNRRFFMENFDIGVNDGIFVMIDIDNFKLINDTYGHIEGDEVLNFFGNKFKEFFSKEMVCRYGGEEFILFIGGTDIHQAYEQVEAFRQKIEREEFVVNFTFSAGLAKYKKGYIKEAILQADKKLYEAKENGRNQVRY